MATLTTSTTRRAALREAIDGPVRVVVSPAPEPDIRGRIQPFLRRWLGAAMLLAAALLATLYIANSIAVNDLLATNTSLEHDRDVARNDNEKLRAELLKLMSVERVTTLAGQQLGMVQPVEPPRELTPGVRLVIPVDSSMTR